MLAQETIGHLWRPWTPNGTAAGDDPFVVVAGEGCEVTDAAGRRYLDAKAGNLTASVGYGRREVVAAASAQLATLMTYDLMTGVTAPAARLAERVAEIADVSLCRTFFCNSGSEATETAVKIARMYHALRGESSRQWVLSLADGYHGATATPTAMTHLAAVRSGNEVSLPGRFATVPTPRCADCAGRRHHTRCRVPGAEALAAAIERLGPEQVAAFVVEPVLGIGGIVIPPAGYLKEVRQVCDRFGVLLVLDEVMTGFGRTGRWFAFQHDGVEPDILVASKGLTGGYLPLATVTTGRDVYDAFAGDTLLGGLRHGHTTAGHATACAAALAVLRIVDDEGLLDNAATVGAALLHQLEPLRQHRWVHDLRGVGLLIGIETDTAAQAAWLAGEAREAGVLLRQQGAVVVVAPPLVVTAAQADTIASVLLDCASRHPDDSR